MPCTNCDSDTIFARGLCQACYNRLRRTGSVARKNLRNLGRGCALSGCAEPAFAKGFCTGHYQQQRHPLRNSWSLLRSRNPGEFPVAWESFDRFLRDIGERPGRRHQLRRLDDTKPYSRTNVHWVEPIPHARENSKKYQREWTLRRKYRLTSDGYDRMKRDQRGLCAICDDPADLHVDHCHASGDVRGLLCLRCNRLLGYARDKTETLRRAIAYLERNEAKVTA